MLLIIKSNLSVWKVSLVAFGLMHVGGDKLTVAKPNREEFKFVFLWTYHFCALIIRVQFSLPSLTSEDEVI